MSVEEQTLNSFGLGAAQKQNDQQEKFDSIDSSTEESDEPSEVDASSENENVEENTEDDQNVEVEKSEIELKMDKIEDESRKWQSRYDQSQMLIQQLQTKWNTEFNQLKEGLNQAQDEQTDDEAYVTMSDIKKREAKQQTIPADQPDTQVEEQNWMFNNAATVARAQEYVDKNGREAVNEALGYIPTNGVGLALAVENQRLQKEVDAFNAKPKAKSKVKPRKKVPKVGPNHSGSGMKTVDNSQLSTFEKQWFATTGIEPNVMMTSR